ncbi:MAG: hypothetical protein KDA37_05800 [Planctomycetales bacterium]|nr:hypothetical protein [Planctomycetales bacterium]
MLNKIWFWLLVIGIVYMLGKSVYLTATSAPTAIESEETASGGPSGHLSQAGKTLTDASLDAAQTSVELCLKLAGVMILWLGVLQVAKDAGMVDALAYALRPVLRWLFPGVPDGHPAQGAMVMNMSANMLGLDNAATPFGLKAMKELQELNEHKEVASDAMATFLAINTSSVTIIPISIIALRSAAESKDPAAPIFGILLATLASTAAAILAVRWLSRLPRFSVSSALAKPDESPTPTHDEQ